MSKEYIDREAILNLCNGMIAEPWNLKTAPASWSDAYLAFKDDVEHFPAADVAPVVHGRGEWFEEWNLSTPDHPIECEDYGWRCGECKTALEDLVYGIFDDIDDKPKLKFCPNCGAKMDKEEN